MLLQVLGKGLAIAVPSVITPRAHFKIGFALSKDVLKWVQKGRGRMAGYHLYSSTRKGKKDSGILCNML